MKVKMLTGMYGPTTARNAGEVHDLDPAEAQRLFAAGFAVPVTPASESAVFAGAPETAVKPPAGKRRRGQAAVSPGAAPAPEPAEDPAPAPPEEDEEFAPPATEE
jgi:hypothetical protein